MATCCNGFANGSGRDDEQEEPASEQQQNSNSRKARISNLFLRRRVLDSRFSCTSLLALRIEANRVTYEEINHFQIMPSSLRPCRLIHQVSEK